MNMSSKKVMTLPTKKEEGRQQKELQEVGPVGAAVVAKITSSEEEESGTEAVRG
jgi:hypothetical protein